MLYDGQNQTLCQWHQDARILVVGCWGVLRLSSDADVLAEIDVSSSRPVESTITTVGFVVRTVGAEQDSQAPSCPECHIQFNLIQPDENDPSRLLGICDSCSRWIYLVELEPDWKTSMMVELPDGNALQQPSTGTKAGDKGQRSEKPGT